MSDLIANSVYAPVLDEITEYIESPGKELWQEINSYIHEKYKARAKIQYSPCAGKKGWNVKYQKAGKALCTLYPEKNYFVSLVVIKPTLAQILPGIEKGMHPVILDLTARTKPYIGGIWLMLPVTDKAMLESVKRLIDLKVNFKE